MPVYEVIYCDTDIVVVNKAPNVPCHPLPSSPTATTLIEAISHEFPEVIAAFQGDREGGLCHRIDNGTSGLVVLARHPSAREHFRALFKQGKMTKSYLALVKGRISESFETSSPIAHHPKNVRKMVVLTSSNIRHRSHPQEARTRGKVLLRNDEASLVRVWIDAGRRHQIRVHLASLGHPLFGDTLYGGPMAEHLTGHALHAATMTLPNSQILEAPCPSSWDDELKRLLLMPA